MRAVLTPHHLTHVQLSRKLQTRELLQRVPDLADSRAHRLRLTRAGRELVRTALADVEAADDEYFAAIGNHRGAFLEALAALGAANRARTVRRLAP
jgi:DNA-binding MarR family transcriptional regulator